MIDQSGSIVDQRREPDSIGWIDNDHLATANEGDWVGGTRGWTVFDTTGKVVWDAGNSLEKQVIARPAAPATGWASRATGSTDRTPGSSASTPSSSRARGSRKAKR